jgi:hypothetical protein
VPPFIFAFMVGWVQQQFKLSYMVISYFIF